ncbi:response regulator [Streptomyces poonensis]|uniref:Transcriptional regulatory protein KdpE n=1 Tax=Streptomyces poonensis TaxID=68255 RepID=A0A918PS09_9ACTN|nr:response regulator [Streptomyces poonensis]GGZ21120.1 DNA-binding response regulator [Streptomyces poonensis]
MTRVLVVEDDAQLARALVINLQARQYTVESAPDGATALALSVTAPPDALILDLGLPDMDGVELIKALRRWSRASVLVLSARNGSEDKIRALDAGADDYMTKPFSMDELLARLRAATRRAAEAPLSAPVTEARITTDAFTVDLVAKRVRRADREVRLTPTEWHLLEILIRNPGRLISQRHLLKEIWGPSHGTKTNYLRVYMAQLRRKLEMDPAHPRYLITEPGMGYRFEP